MNIRKTMVGVKSDMSLVIGESRGVGGNWSCTCRCDCGNTYNILTKYFRKNKHNSCGCKTPFAKNEVGKTYSRLTVLSKAENTKQGDARFNCRCECGELLVVTGSSLRSGHTNSCGCSMIKEKLYYGQGLYTKGKYTTSIGGRLTKEFTVWVKMLERCYREKCWETNPTYEKCQVSDNFKNFQFFAEWCNNQKGFYEDGWHLDKDIFGGILYSEDTCCFIPKELNLFLSTLKKKNQGELPTGVVSRGEKFRAYIKHRGKSTCLGTFHTPEEAYLNYLEKKSQHFLEEITLLTGVLDTRVIDTLYVLLAEFKSRAGSRPVSN